MSRYALLLLLLGTSALLLSVVDAQGQSGNNGNNGGNNGGGNSNNNKGKSNSARDEAVTANKVGKPKKGAAGSINGTLKSDMFTTCFNKINQDMAKAKRRKGDRPAKARGRKNTSLAAVQSCLDDTLNTCSADTSGNGTTGSVDIPVVSVSPSPSPSPSPELPGRRLLNLALGTNVRDLSIEESRESLRALLQAAEDDDDDDLEMVMLDNEDEDDNAFAEFVAGNLEDDELDTLCSMAENEATRSAMRTSLDPKNNATVTASNFRRTPLSVSLDMARNAAALDRQRAESGRRRLQQAAASCKDVHVKSSTESRVSCDNRGLAKAIQPAYSEDEPGSFRSAIDGPISFGYIKTTGENSVESNDNKFAEYTNGDKWGENFLVTQAFTQALQVLDKVFELATEGCQISEAFETWVGFGGRVSVAPASPVCRPIVIGAKVAALITKIAAVDTPLAIAEAAGNYDGNIQAAESESIAENVLSVIYNQGVGYDQVVESTATLEEAVQNSTESTAATVNAAADGIEQAIENSKQAVIARIDALDVKVTTRFDALDARINEFEANVQKRLCDLQNAIASVHSTVNYIQQLLLVPEGTRPGYNNIRLQAPGCATSTPAVCSNATSTARVNGATCVAPSAPVGRK